MTIRIEHRASRAMGAGRAWHVLIDGESTAAGLLSLGEFATDAEARSFAATVIDEATQ